MGLLDLQSTTLTLVLPVPPVLLELDLHLDRGIPGIQSLWSLEDDAAVIVIIVVSVLVLLDADAEGGEVLVLVHGGQGGAGLGGVPGIYHAGDSICNLVEIKVFFQRLIQK